MKYWCCKKPKISIIIYGKLKNPNKKWHNELTCSPHSCAAVHQPRRPGWGVVPGRQHPSHLNQLKQGGGLRGSGTVGPRRALDLNSIEKWQIVSLLCFSIPFYLHNFPGYAAPGPGDVQLPDRVLRGLLHVVELHLDVTEPLAAAHGGGPVLAALHRVEAIPLIK